MASNSALPIDAAPRDQPARRRAWSPLHFREQPFFEDKNRAFWILQSSGWVGYFFLRTLSNIGNANEWSMELWSYALHNAMLTAAGFSMTLLMASAFRRLIRMKPVYTWVGAIMLVVIAAAGFSAIETWSFATFVDADFRPEGLRFLGAILLTVSLLIAWAALYFSINYFLLLEAQSGRLERLESQASNAQLAMLRYQLNPHFLFNTLNSISTLVLLKQTDRANAMLSRLSSFLRYTLVNESTGMVTIAQEIETLKLYLEIETMRFEERLRPHFHIEQSVSRAHVPSLLLQPLIENAIKYAVTPQEEGADISIEIRREVDRVMITVCDTGPGPDAQTSRSLSTGVGLANIRDRLAQAYGDNHRFETSTDSTGGFRVFIEIPYQIETEEPK